MSWLIIIWIVLNGLMWSWVFLFRLLLMWFVSVLMRWLGCCGCGFCGVCCLLIRILLSELVC